MAKTGHAALCSRRDQRRPSDEQPGRTDREARADARGQCVGVRRIARDGSAREAQGLGGTKRPARRPEEVPHLRLQHPNPSGGSPKYGYEVWITVSRDVEPEGDVRIGDFSGGPYAATRCEVPAGEAGNVIPATWQKLASWCKNNNHKRGTHQWLEESIPADLPAIEFVLDLYHPIAG